MTMPTLAPLAFRWLTRPFAEVGARCRSVHILITNAGGLPTLDGVGNRYDGAAIDGTERR